ncbi:MAG: UDP-2,3-diacylglucosamine diphosphatase [Pseudomonadota bacterium]
MIEPQSSAASTSRITGRSAFLSDVHLGTRNCRAEALLEFLTRLNTDNLFLVGDIVDLQRMASAVHWPRSHTAIIHKLFSLAAAGMRVVFIPGNHDAALRVHAGTTVNGVEIRLNAIHQTADGRRLLITHGDQFDSELRIGSLKEKIGSAAYEWLLGIDVGINRVRSRFGYEETSIASAVKMRVRSAQQYIREYEQLAADNARKRGLDGIVCGHIHKPEIARIDETDYLNTGDWVEHGTALLEDRHGRMQLIHTSDATAVTSEPQAA